jgi:hypothetical protein
MSHFYIVNTDDENFDVMVNKSTNQYTEPRCSLDKTKAVLEVRHGVDSSPEFDLYEPALNHEEAFDLMQSDEWQNNTI